MFLFALAIFLNLLILTVTKYYKLQVLKCHFQWPDVRKLEISSPSQLFSQTRDFESGVFSKYWITPVLQDNNYKKGCLGLVQNQEQIDLFDKSVSAFVLYSPKERSIAHSNSYFSWFWLADIKDGHSQVTHVRKGLKNFAALGKFEWLNIIQE